MFEEITSKDDAQEYTDFGSTSLVFEVDGKNLVVVIDSLDCEDIEVDEIYTGEIDNNVELLTLLHQVYN